MLRSTELKLYTYHISNYSKQVKKKEMVDMDKK